VGNIAFLVSLRFPWIPKLDKTTWPMYSQREMEYDIMTDDISTTVAAISAVIGLIAGVVGAFIYFRVGLENRLTKLEAALPEGRLGGYETKLNDLEQKMAELGFILEIMREVGTDHVEEVFGRRHS
jgi:hypothetical protein